MSATSNRPGVTLLTERLNRGLSPEDAAAEIGISRVTLQRAESDLPIQAAKAKLIADFYGVLVTDIWPVDEAA